MPVDEIRSVEALKFRLGVLAEQIEELDRGVHLGERAAVVWAEARLVRNRLIYLESLYAAFEEGKRRILARGLANAIASGCRI